MDKEGPQNAKGLPALRHGLKLFMLVYWFVTPLLAYLFLKGKWAKSIHYLFLGSILIHTLETLFNVWRARRLQQPCLPWLIITALFGSVAIAELKSAGSVWEETMKPIIPEVVLRYTCLLVALANAVGNFIIFFFYQPLFEWMNIPLPTDVPYFLWMTGFSFNVGVLAYFIFREPERNRDMLKVGIIGKCIFAGLTLDFYFSGGISQIFLGIGIFDGWAALMFALYLARLTRCPIRELNESPVPLHMKTVGTTQNALVLYYSLTGNTRNGADRIASGLEATGYRVDLVPIEVERPRIAFPFPNVWAFISLTLRSIFRTPVEIKPLNIQEDRDYDLIILGTQTWFVGMGLPMQAVFEQARYRPIFDGKDVAIFIICRGLWRRSQAMLFDRVQRWGGNVIAIRAYTHAGKEPSRFFSLAFYLIYHKVGKPAWLRWLLQERYGPSEADLEDLRCFGVSLGHATGEGGIQWKR